MIQSPAFNTLVSGWSLRPAQEFDNLKNSPVATVWFIKYLITFQNVHAAILALGGFASFLILHQP